MSNQIWKGIFEEQSIDRKADSLQKMIMEKVNEYLSEKTRKIASDDDPWVKEDVKILKRRRQREYSKNKRSLKY